MKLIRVTKLLLSLAVLASVDRAHASDRVAVFDFSTDWHTDYKIGVTDAGEPFASLLTFDLSALPSFKVVDREAARKVQISRKLGLNDPMTPKVASEIGVALGASVLVTGRLYKTGSDIVATVKVISVKTGQVSGTIVKGSAGSLANVASRLAAQVSDIVQIQKDGEPIHWDPASIVGTQVSKPPSAADGSTYVAVVDGTAITDAAANWSKKRTLLPGVHEIVIGHVALPRDLMKDIAFVAKAGSAYELRCRSEKSQNFEISIREIGSDDPVTVIVGAPAIPDSWGDHFVPDGRLAPVQGLLEGGTNFATPSGVRGK
jgi:TolB-like protein